MQRRRIFGVRKPRDTAGEILPVPPLIKEGTQKPPFVKGAARSAGGFGNVAVMKRTFASRIAWLPHSKGEAVSKNHRMLLCYRPVDFFHPGPPANTTLVPTSGMPAIMEAS